MDAANQLPGVGGSAGTSPTYEFPPFVLDTTRRLLLREAQPVTLTPKTYDALRVLVESRGRFLSKAELLQSLWPNSFVEESNLTQQISTVRKALGERPGEDRYILTVPGRGYRFVAEVRKREDFSKPVPSPDVTALLETEKIVTGKMVASPADAVVAGIEKAPPPAKPQRFQRRAVLVSLLAVVLLAFGYTVYRKGGGRTGPSPRPRSLAILPFRNLKGDPQSDFLGFSLADAVIAKVNNVGALSVRPSSAVERYRNQVIDVQQVAERLQVDTLLTGNFMREGDDLRITSELIDIATERILWKSAFDLKYEKLLTVQESVAQQIVNGLALHLSASEVALLGADRPIDPLAYEFYLRGVDLYARSDFPLAIKMLEKSTELNPKYALTWAHLGRAYNAMASFQFGGREQYRRAQAAYEKALSLQPTQPETQVYMANMLTDTGRVEQAVPLLRKALASNPNYAEAHWELGYAYRFAGALQESLGECERARQLDPGVKLNSSTFNTYLYIEQYDRFLESLPKSDKVPLIVFYRGFGEYYRRNTQEAAAHFDRAFELDQSLLQAQVGKALSYSIRNELAKGIQLLRESEAKIQERSVGDPEAIYKIAQAYALLGDRESAMRMLQTSIAGGFFPYPYLKKDPLLDSLRSERAFTALMAAARQRHELFKRNFL
jgi:DNA-binding winged helix-turn-helix (wHTH) protein/TolB-like protein